MQIKKKTKTKTVIIIQTKRLLIYILITEYIFIQKSLSIHVRVV